MRSVRPTDKQHQSTCNKKRQGDPLFTQSSPNHHLALMQRAVSAAYTPRIGARGLARTAGAEVLLHPHARGPQRTPVQRLPPLPVSRGDALSPATCLSRPRPSPSTPAEGGTHGAAGCPHGTGGVPRGAGDPVAVWGGQCRGPGAGAGHGQRKRHRLGLDRGPLSQVLRQSEQPTTSVRCQHQARAQGQCQDPKATSVPRQESVPQGNVSTPGQRQSPGQRQYPRPTPVTRPTPAPRTTPVPKANASARGQSPYLRPTPVPEANVRTKANVRAQAGKPGDRSAAQRHSRPNKRVQATAYSVRSFLAPAFSRA